MPQNIVGTGGADTLTLNDTSAGIHTVNGLNGDDSVYTFALDPGPFARVDREGGFDTINVTNYGGTVRGGDGNDSIQSLSNASPGNVALFGNFGNEGDDTITNSPGNDTVFAGQGNDSVIAFEGGRGQFFLNEGNDTFDGVFSEADNPSPMTVQGGNDSADGNDSIVTGSGADLILGNGGRDTLSGGNGNNTLVGGFESDLLLGGNGGDFLFGNEGDDVIFMGSGEAAADTVFGGQGNDRVFVNVGSARSVILGNEGNDTIRAGGGADTITGGAGADRFEYVQSNDDGDGAAGGPIEHITDVNFAEDRFHVSAVNVVFAATAGTGNATTLTEAARNAMDTVWRQNTVSGSVAAVFNWTGRTYLAIDTFTNGVFQDGADILIDVTGAAGTVSASNFAN